MKIIKLAFRNLMGAGLRTWLNVIVLSFAFIIIIWYKGLINGWDRQAQKDMIEWEFGGGQYWNKNYDPYDPFTLDESHAVIPAKMQKAVNEKKLAPVLITQGTLYPEGREQSVFIKGIDVSQTAVKLPTDKLKVESHEIPAIIGKRLAKNCKLEVGEVVTLRWRDKNGTFDAKEIKIAEIFYCNVPTVDMGHVWVSLENLQTMLQMPGEATKFITSNEDLEEIDAEGWIFKGHDYLLADMKKLIKAKSIGGSVFYIIIMFLAMLAIFDTQVLSIFRRQREIGTLIALGMTRGEVVRLFTAEGGMHSILAAVVGSIYGIPFLIHQAKTGWAMAEGSDEFGISIADVIYPAYSVSLIVGTIIIVLVTTTIVSYLPSRKISKMKPTEALRGKLQ